MGISCQQCIFIYTHNARNRFCVPCSMPGNRSPPKMWSIYCAFASIVINSLTEMLATVAKMSAQRVPKWKLRWQSRHCPDCPLPSFLPETVVLFTNFIDDGDEWWSGPASLDLQQQPTSRHMSGTSVHTNFYQYALFTSTMSFTQTDFYTFKSQLILRANFFEQKHTMNADALYSRRRALKGSYKLEKKRSAKSYENLSKEQYRNVPVKLNKEKFKKTTWEN